MPRFDEGEQNLKLIKGNIVLMGNPDQYGEILAENIFVEDITRAALQTLISGSNLVRGKYYRITNAVGSTLSLVVKAVTADVLDEVAVNSTNGDNVIYNITTDVATVPYADTYVPYTGATTNVDLGEFGLDSGFVTYDTTPTNTPTTQGTTYWDANEETIALIMNGATQHIGLDTFYNAKNSTGTTIPKGTAVRFAGTDGNSGHLLIAPMLADGTYPSEYYMGITAEAISNGDYGKVIQFGKLRGFNTNAYNAGDILYVSTTVAGGFQTTIPTAPNNIIIAAAAINSTNNGTIMVRATIGSNINNDEGVKITSPTTGQLLQLQSNGLWENKTKAQILGGTSSQFVKGDGSLDSTSYTPTSRQLTINGTTYDLSVNRTWTIPTHDAVTIGTANGLSLLGQQLSLGLSSSSANGALSSTDWSTFNAKQPALNGTGFVKISGTTINYDNSTYLTGNQTITLSGEASGTGATSINVTLDNGSVTGKLLTGLSITGSAVVSTDSILTAVGKLQNQVNALAGGVSYQGTWNASTNTPSLSSGTGTKGYYYVVSVAGSTNLDGITDWKLGDWAIFNGTTWNKVDNTDAVISVNGYTGIVTLSAADVGAVSTVAGTANQVLVNGGTSAQTGAVTLSLPQSIATTSNVRFNTLALGGAIGSNALRIITPIAGGVFRNGISIGSEIQSDVTSGVSIFESFPTLQAASFTLANLYHYGAYQGSIGAGATLTTQQGFFVSSTMIGATNNYGFRGQLASGTGRWNIYMDGTANNYFNGNVQIGSTTPTTGAEKLQVTGSASVSGNTLIGGNLTVDTNTFFVDATNNRVGIGTITPSHRLNIVHNNSGLNTGIFSITNTGAAANSGTSIEFNGANGSAQIVNMARIGTLLINGTPGNESSDIEISTISGGVFSEKARILANGSVLIGTTSNPSNRKLLVNGTFEATGNSTIGGTLAVTGAVTGSSTAQFTKLGLGGAVGATNYFLITGNITGNANIFTSRISGTIQSDVTGNYYSYQSVLSLQATSFNLSNVSHFIAQQAGLSGGATITTQAGYTVDSNLTGATNNYGFRGQIPSGTGRWNIYMDGTANNYFAGNVQIGSTTPTAGAEKLQVTGTASISSTLLVGGAVIGSSTAQFTRLGVGIAPASNNIMRVGGPTPSTNPNTTGFLFDTEIQSVITNNYFGFGTAITTQQATFTLANLNHFSASQGTFGAGSVVTNQRGFLVSSSMIGATNNYAFQGSIPSGTGRWNIYMDGTASNYFAGNVQIGSTTATAGAEKLQVTGTASVSGALSIGNTVQVSVATPSTHKVTIVIGGVTYYLLATNV